jgi:phosphoglycolate phosphatase-like HAD superfamily hydrolase
MKLKGFLFDLDGTLANTLPLCIKVYQETLQHITGRAYTESEITINFGLTEAGIFQQMVPEHWQEALDYYHTTYERLHDECNAPFPGITDALQLLKARGLKMAVVTGKGMHTALFTLQYLGINDYFEFVEAGKEDALVKADAMRKILHAWGLAPQTAAYIGDSASDVEQSAKAEVLPLAAEWAATATIHELEEIRPYASFRTVESFIKWIEQNIEPVESVGQA